MLRLLNSAKDISKTTVHLRETIQSQEIKASWPPRPYKLTENAVTIPDYLKEFLFTLLTGSTRLPGLQLTHLVRTWYLMQVVDHKGPQSKFYFHMLNLSATEIRHHHYAMKFLLLTTSIHLSVPLEPGMILIVLRRLCLVKLYPTKSMESWFKLIILVSILRQIQRQSSRNPRGELLSQ